MPLISLQASPFNLAVGDIINAKILAFNDYGSSSMSPIGGTAKMVQISNAPINLANNPTVTTSQNISFTWYPAAFDGGTVVLDYSIFFEQSTDIWQPLAVNYLTTSYTTTTGLLAGKTYNFKVYARNSVGLSLPAAVSILAA